MRAGEQLRFAETAKQIVSAPRPSSAPFGGTFPEGKVWGGYNSPLRAKSTAANQREGQAPPLHYDEMGTIFRGGSLLFCPVYALLTMAL